MSHYAICNWLNSSGIPCPSVVLRSKGKIQADNRNRSGIWLYRAIKQIIRNPLYLGHLVYGKSSQSLADNKPQVWQSEDDWVICENTHEPIVSRELWDRANAVEKERREIYASHLVGKATLPKNIFQGLLVCGHCNSTMQRSHSSRTRPNGKYSEYYYYSCINPHKHQEQQKQQPIRLEVIYDLVYPLVTDALQTASNLGAIIEKRAKQQVNPRATLDAEITRTSQELETVNQRIAGLYESYVDKLLSEMEYVNMKTVYENRAGALRQKIDHLSIQATTIVDVSKSNNQWLKATRDFQNPSELTREMLVAIVERIEVYSAERVVIVWKFKDEYALLESYVSENSNIYTASTTTGRKKEGV